MKMLIATILFSTIAGAQTYSGPSSASIQLQINVVQAQQKMLTDAAAQQAAQQALAASRLSTQLSKLQTSLAAAQAAGQ